MRQTVKSSALAGSSKKSGGSPVQVLNTMHSLISWKTRQVLGLFAAMEFKMKASSPNHGLQGKLSLVFFGLSQEEAGRNVTNCL